MPETGPPLRQNLRFGTDGRETCGYLAVPEGGAGPGVVVIHEWWGLTDQIAGVAEQLSANGFTALAPDLYGGRTTHDPVEAARLARGLPLEQAVRGLSPAVDHLLAHEAVKAAAGTEGDAVGVIGFGAGGGCALALAAASGPKVAAAVPYYGLVTADRVDFRRLHADILGHYGERDPDVPPAKAAEVAERIRDCSGTHVEIHHYNAGHAFANEENHAGTYDLEADHIAWERTLAFLTARLHDAR